MFFCRNLQLFLEFARLNIEKITKKDIKGSRNAESICIVRNEADRGATMTTWNWPYTVSKTVVHCAHRFPPTCERLTVLSDDQKTALTILIEIICWLTYASNVGRFIHVLRCTVRLHDNLTLEINTENFLFHRKLTCFLKRS